MFRAELEPGQEVERLAQVAAVVQPASDRGQVRKSGRDVVRALLEDPSRLSSEYERRLDDSRRKHSRDDRDVLEGQIRRLRGGIGRLIDGYAEGWIEKAEFEPRVRRLKERIYALEAQLREDMENEERRNDLRLLIGQLEDFAGSVSTNLDRLEWEKRRGIVRALVKRVEVDHERVTVVFRVGRGPIVLDPEQSVSQDRFGRGSCGPSFWPNRRSRAP